MRPIPSYNGYRYILTFVDMYSHLLIAFPTKDHSATTMARVVMDNIFPHYRVPLAIHSDNAP